MPWSLGQHLDLKLQPVRLFEDLDASGDLATGLLPLVRAERLKRKGGCAPVKGRPTPPDLR